MQLQGISCLRQKHFRVLYQICNTQIITIKQLPPNVAQLGKEQQLKGLLILLVAQPKI